MLTFEVSAFHSISVADIIDGRAIAIAGDVQGKYIARHLGNGMYCNCHWIAVSIVYTDEVRSCSIKTDLYRYGAITTLADPAAINGIEFCLLFFTGDLIDGAECHKGK